MKRSVLLAVLVGFGVVAVQAGSVQAKEVKGQSASHAVNPLKAVKHQGGTLVSEQGPFSPSKPKLNPPKTIKHQGGTLVSEEGPFGPSKPSAPPVWSKFPTGTFKQQLPPFKVTFGGNPPRAPQSGNCDHHGCDHDGCNHDGCDHHGWDRRHDRHDRWVAMYFGDMCYRNYYGSTCSDFDFCR